MRHKTLKEYIFEKKVNEILDNELCLLIETISCSCKKISSLIRKGALENIFGDIGHINIQGEEQKKLDVIANEIFLKINEKSGTLCGMASEEMEDIYQISSNKKGKYLLIFDPLDGSSNINVNVSIGSIFSVVLNNNYNENSLVNKKDFLIPGNKQIFAGYALYGPQTILVITLGKGVYGFTLDINTNDWILTHENITIPQSTNNFSINMSNMNYWNNPIKKYIEDCLIGNKGPLRKNYNMRWVGSMVSDIHRILIQGGIFIYPPDSRESYKFGKIRLMYEANPISFIIEQAKGSAINGIDRILDIIPKNIHERIGIILGSEKEVSIIKNYYKNNNKC
ncbi:Fructose-1,6-bisphosphatase class 1 [Candidatus Kinetoplastibacterium sorsogonicusi]|uniref:Fructose-1,6-bisphosphatase class 1 n=1 Tax=Candidatus Kinetoplastidibacterium kentomonadis TaxID=1576550 RepID=A0A3S7J9W8_9PROT|nr:class 1 fructose-bisphosphatase [Candidatus Kinetoplastibacterium sorsogonicusi]AWD32468.1 Fructose-1,6-bisphosphatase class 1 [Candidatus Kinetoplastibacterium sorsogonicusi]